MSLSSIPLLVRVQPCLLLRKLGLNATELRLIPSSNARARAKLLYRSDPDAYLDHIIKVSKCAENLQGCYVPVIEWMGALAQAAGFESFEFEKTRERNVKWKNRKHRVPLCEGCLWVRG